MVAGAFGLQKTASLTTHLMYNGSPLEIYFSPQDGSLAQVIAQVDAAQSTIDFAIFFFTEDALHDALIAAHARGVRIRGLWDELGAANGSSDDEALCAAGISLKIEDTPGKMHHKLMIVDAAGASPRVVTGSLNWTEAGDHRNSENTVIVYDAGTAQGYAAAFAGLWAAMEPATQCNVGGGPAVGASVYLPVAVRAIESVPTATATPTLIPIPSGLCPCTGDLYNCADFATHSQAQACFDWYVSQGAGMRIGWMRIGMGWRVRVCRWGVGCGCVRTLAKITCTFS